MSRRRWKIAAAVALVGSGLAVYFGGEKLLQNHVTETSIQPESLSPQEGGSPLEFIVGFRWTEQGYCSGQFWVKATESPTEVRVGAVISRKYLTGACAGLGTDGKTATTPLSLGSPLGMRKVVRDSDGVALPVHARSWSLPCSTAIASRASPPSDFTVVFNQVALPTSNALQASASGESDPTARIFAKAALFVGSSAGPVLLSVPDSWVGRLTIGWGSPAQRTTHLFVQGCKASGSQERWLVFAGGFWVTEPACVPIVVRSGSQEQTVQIGVGAACPGQTTPPPGT